MPAPKKKETYSQAMERLEKIVSQIDNNELEIDELAVKIKEANEIIAFCSDKLTKATSIGQAGKLNNLEWLFVSLIFDVLILYNFFGR